jgi:hypothetical protein
MAMIRKQHFFRLDQIEKLALLTAVIPGHPDESSLIRDGVDLLLDKHLNTSWVKDLIEEHRKKEQKVRMIKSVD